VEKVVCHNPLVKRQQCWGGCQHQESNSYFASAFQVNTERENTKNPYENAHKNLITHFGKSRIKT
jgi:hypothetical protein